MFQYHVRDLGNIQKNDGGIVMTFKAIGWEGYFTIGGCSKNGFTQS